MQVRGPDLIREELQVGGNSNLIAKYNFDDWILVHSVYLVLECLSFHLERAAEPLNRPTVMRPRG